MNRRCCATVLILSFGATASAQKPTTEFWPELDVYWTPAKHQRTFLELSSSADQESAKREDSVGLYQDYLMLPAGYWRGGFRYTTSARDNSYREYRFVGEGTFRTWSSGLLRLVNRGRLEIRDVNNAWSYRIRERLHLQRVPSATTPIGLGPYITFEAYYYSQYNTIARLGGRVGAEARVWGPVSVDVYIARQNNTRTLPRYLNALGLTTKLTY